MSRSFALSLSALSAAVSLTLVAPAQAATMMAVFKGTITQVNGDGLDVLGVQDALNLPFVFTATYDPTLGHLTEMGNPPLIGINLGGPSDPASGASPVLSDELQVNGRTIDLPTIQSSGILQDTGLQGDTPEFGMVITNGLGSGVTFDMMQAGANLPSDLSQPFELDGVENLGGSFELVKTDPRTNGQGLEVRMQTTQVIVTQVPSAPGGGEVGGVPEPASWALMITGFGFAGTMLRRRAAFQATN